MIGFVLSEDETERGRFPYDSIVLLVVEPIQQGRALMSTMTDPVHFTIPQGQITDIIFPDTRETMNPTQSFLDE